MAMLERLQVKNFRGLRDLEIEGLARINLIGGRNNSGKTSLLEAVLLLSAAGNPSTVLEANVIRGLDAVDRSSDAVQWLGSSIGWTSGRAWRWRCAIRRSAREP